MKTKKDIWIQRFRDWEESGLRRAEYCRRHQIPVSTFDFWRQKIRKETVDSSERHLVKLPVLIKPSEPSFFTIEYPTGHKIKVPECYTSESLKRLIQDLSEALG